jgi:hypothetical protein
MELIKNEIKNEIKKIFLVLLNDYSQLKFQKINIMDYIDYRAESKRLSGKRIRCIAMKPDKSTGKPDPNPIESGQEGEINSVDDAGTIHVFWDNGRTLGLIYGYDRYEIL